ncbi:Uracil DNA glycosylase-like protein [Elsinoe fawcettii]|nr:Uracil DNA glycosylase-like protein [Elsinoe fawcettii]
MPATRSGKRKRSEPLRETNDNSENIKIETEQSQKTKKDFKSSLEKFHYSSTTTLATAPITSAPVSPQPETPLKRTPRKPAQRPTSPVVDSPNSSTKKSKEKRPSSSYAPPSTYSHLPVLTDVITPSLIVLFVGTNPGIRTATAGHAYAHPSNLFWKLLHSSGCTDRRLDPTEDVHLPQLYAMGNTNIVERPTRDAGELSKAEMTAGAPILEAKVRRFRPEAVCIVGKGIWEAVWRHRHGKNPGKDEFKYGWQDDEERMGRINGYDGEEPWEGARVFVSSSTSGLAASLGPKEKEEIWRPFGEWVKARREERIKLGIENPVWEGATRFVKKEDEEA